MTIKQQGGIFGRNPTFNEIEVDSSLNVNNDNLYVSDNTVGIGTSSPVSLISGGDGPVLSIGGTDNVLTNNEKTGTISFITSDGSYKGTYSDGIAAEIACITETATGAGYGLAFYTGVTTASNRAERLRISRAGDVELKTGNLIVPSGNGIDFSATSGTGTSELFDDYEEGLHTVTVTPSTSGSVTLNNPQVRYTKIGNTVFISGNIRCTSVSSPVGTSIQFSLPFAIADGAFTSERIGSAIVYYDGSSDSLAFVTADTGTTSYVKQTIDASTIAAGDQWRFNFFYVTS